MRRFTGLALAGVAVISHAAAGADAPLHPVRVAKPDADSTTAISEPDATQREKRPTVGLVLGGGGARGLAHVGVLKLLEDLRIPVDVVAGTSMGAIVGGLYASGYSPDEIEAAVGGIDWNRAFFDQPARKDLSFRRKEDDNDALLPLEVGVGRRGLSVKSGAVAGQRINFILRSLTLHTKGVESFDDLPIPFRAVAADLETGEAVALDRGELSTAMRASMAIPAVFTPVELDGRLYVDGGLIKNLPIDVVKKLGADVIIAVDVGSDPEELGGDLSALEVASRSISVLRRRDLLAQRALLTERDFLIEPALGETTIADFAAWSFMIDAGEATAREQSERLSRLGVPPDEWDRFVASQRHDRESALTEMVVDRIDVRAVEPLDSRVVERRLDSEAGRPIDLEDVEHDLLLIDQLGEYETVEFDVEDDDGATVLSMTARKKNWGPGYLRFGIFVESDFEGDSELGIIANFRLTEINRLGAEWRTIARVGAPLTLRSEFFQPLNRKRYWFVAPIFELSQDQDRRILESGDVEVVDRDEAFAELDLGAQLGNWGEIRVGARKGRFDTEAITTTDFDPFDADTGGWVFRAVVDEFDSAFFPRSGVRAHVDLLLSRDSLGADFEYDRLEAGYTHAGSIGKNVLVGDVQLGSGLGSDIPFFDDFELGGFLNLSGVEQGALQDDAFTLVSLIYYREVFELGPLGQIYAGIALQVGNVWPELGDFDLGESVFSATLFAGADTALVPVYIGYGIAEGGESEAYLFIGQAF